jgi:hypothetical protein
MTTNRVNISTYDLVGMLNDVLPFAADPKGEEQLAVVLMSWDGETGMLEVHATNRHVTGVCTWDPDDAPDYDVQVDMFVQPGGGSESWSVYLTTLACKAICADFKMPDKEATQAMMTILHDSDTDRVTVSRERAGVRPGKNISINGIARVDNYPHLREQVARAAIDPAAAPTIVHQVGFSPYLLGLFSEVRARGGYLTLTFLAERLTLVNIGPRFIGTIVPVRERDPRDDVAARVPAGADVDDGPSSDRPHDHWLTGYPE